MKALSIRQPWAWLIVRPDITDQAKREEAYRTRTIKDIENRTWPTKFRGPVLIHAGKGMTAEEYEDVALMLEDDTTPFAAMDIQLPPMKQLDRGGIVGIAEIVGCINGESQSPWYFSEFGFVLRKQRPLPFTPMRGMLGFFDAPADYEVPA